jgi:hypothetical protein
VDEGVVVDREDSKTVRHDRGRGSWTAPSAARKIPARGAGGEPLMSSGGGAE